MTGGDARRTGAGRAGRPSRAAPLALFVLLAAAIAGAGALSYAASAADLRRERERELAAIATLKVDELERWRDERLVDADGVAADPTLLALLAGGAPRPDRARRDIEAWFEVLRGVGEYSAIVVLDVDGRLRLGAGEIGADPAAPEVRAIVRRAVDERRAIVSDLHRHGSDDTVHLTVASPIRTGVGPARDAVLLRIDPQRWLFRMVQSWPSPSATAEMLLVGVEDGVRAAVLNEPRHVPPDRSRLTAPLTRADDPLVRASIGPPGVFEGLDHRGVRVISAVEPVPGTSWRLVAKVDVDEALAPLARLRHWILAGVTALVAAAAAGAAFWWRAQLAGFERHRLAGEAARLTERKLAEEALRASEAKFRAAFEFASLGILLVAPDGRVVETNRALRKMLDSGEDELRAQTFEGVHAAGDRPSAAAILRQMREGAVGTVELPRRLLRRDGSLADVVLRASALRDEGGAFRFALAVVEDVTERKRLEAQLVLADRMASVGTLAAGVAHEINNPLAFILANLEFALTELHGAGADAEVLRALVEARDGGLRVREIVRDLKAFSRADGGEGREAVDLRRVLQSALGLAQNEIRHRARLEVEAGEVPPVIGSEHRLGQVLLNLLINAAQAIPEGRSGENVVRAVTGTSPDGRASVAVSDTGSGIPPEVLPRIFDPFFTTKPVGVGTGLGLSICHGIVSGLGGEIRVDSTPGKGSTFLVLLPAAPAAAAGEPPGELGPAAEGARRGRILVVDDEPLVGRAVSRTLSPLHDVVVRSSARAALEEVARGPAFDVLLCDLMMPEVTGMELYARLGEVAPSLAERTVFLTGGAFTPAAREFLARVPNPRVEKPFEPEELRALVARLLAEHPLRAAG